MIRTTMLLSATCAAAMVLSLPALSQDRVVNVLNWSDYIDDSLLAQFTEQTGIRVVYDVFDSNEVLETRLLATDPQVASVDLTGKTAAKSTAKPAANPLTACVTPVLACRHGLCAEYGWPSILVDLAGRCGPA